MGSGAVQIAVGGKGASVAVPGPFDLRGRIPELDGIRGIAISMVLIWHYFVTQMNAPAGSLGAYALAAGRLSWSGVDLFFVLSGFLIGGILLDARSASNYFRVFYTRRFFRIIPIYAVLLALSYFICTLIRFGDADHLVWLSMGRLPFKPFVLFLQNFWMAYASTYGAVLLAVTWSLAIEEQFYLTLPVVIRFVKCRSLVALLIVGVVFAPILRLTFHILWPAHFLAWYTIMPCRADALLLGVLGAIFMRSEPCREWLKKRRVSFHLLLLVLILGFGALTKYAADFWDTTGTWVVTFGFTWLAVFYLCVILYVLTWRGSILSRCLRWRWLCWMGSIAYGVYLFHFPILYATYGLIWFREPEITSAWNFCVTLLALAVTLIVCKLSWEFLEKPLVKIGHRERHEFGLSSSSMRVSAVAVTES